MNKERRKRLGEGINQTEGLRSYIESILLDEQLAFDNMPEGLQSSMRGIESEEAIEHMEDAISSLDDVIAALQEIV